MSNNLNKLFYKDYYQGITFKYALAKNNQPTDFEKNRIKNTNKNLLKATLQPKTKELAQSLKSLSSHSLTLTVCYPGLVTGIGLVHDSKKLDGAFNLGMHFNYTYGVPVIYGSSVKGLLRAYFKEFYNGTIDKDALVADIFDGVNNNEPKPMYQRDVFFDAVLIEGCSKRNGKILDSDSITSHRAGALKEPNPVTFLKIAAGCRIRFFFNLKDSTVNGTPYSAVEKKNLFKDILLAVGAGAKTNVGYGQFEETAKDINENK